MANPCAAYTLGSTGLIVNGDETDDRLFTGNTANGVQGLDGAQIRAPVDPQGVQDGLLVHEKFLGGREIVFSGEVQIVTAPYFDDVDAYLLALEALEDSWRTGLETMLNTPFTLSWSSKSITVTYGFEGAHLQFGGTAIAPTFTFGLLAASPTIS